MRDLNAAGPHFPADQFLFNQGEAAEILGFTRHLVRLAIREGKLDTRKVGSLTFVTRASLLRYRAWLRGDSEQPDPPLAA